MSFRITTKNSVYVISQEGDKRVLRKWKNGKGTVVFHDVHNFSVARPPGYATARLVAVGRCTTSAGMAAFMGDVGTLITSKVVDQFEVLTRVDGFKAAIRSNPDAVIDPSFDL